MKIDNDMNGIRHNINALSGRGLALVACGMLLAGGLSSCSDDAVAEADASAVRADEPVSVRFSSTVGEAQTTRGGTQGMMTTTTMKAADGGGFGVFAYNTGTSTFATAESDNNVAVDGKIPVNYMYNEKVTWTSTDANDATKGTWDCALPKYWPNPTITSDATTIKPQFVTFLAYAPYVESPASDGYGIVGFTQAGTSDDAGKYTAATNKSDMMIHYLRNADKQVDLLWGTAGTNGAPAKILDENGKTVTIDADNSGKDLDNATYTTDNAYGSAANDAKVNADLTKMTTTGTVQFRFRHALGAFGGSPAGPSTAKGNGIIIDTNTSDGTGLTGNARLFVNWIAIELMNNDPQTTDSYGPLPSEGYFDLVTGQWYRTPAASGDLKAKDKRTKAVLYFSPNSSEPTDEGYKKYLTQYETDGITANMTSTENLNESLWAKYPSTATTVNGYSSDWLNTDATDFVSDIPNGVGSTAITIYQDKKIPLFLIPGTKLTVNVVANYDIITPDASNANKFTKKHYELAKETDFKNTIQMNKYYGMDIHLGTNIEVVIPEFDINDWGQAWIEPDADTNDWTQSGAEPETEVNDWNQSVTTTGDNTITDWIEQK